MISTGQIVAAGVITGLCVAAAARLARWRWAGLLAASVGALTLIAAWRLAANALHLNEDFMPAVSLGDAGCLVFGALAPAVTAVAPGTPKPSRWAPAITGAVAGFLVDVLIL